MVLDIPLVCTFIAIIACFYASYTDLKSGIIQNKLTFSLIGLGIVLNAVYAFMINDMWFIIIGVLFTAVIFALGYIFWKLGAWAGGDVKLFTALAALLPFYPLVLNYNIFGVAFPIVSFYGFPLTLIINSLLSILPFLLIYVLFIAIKRKPYLVDELLTPVKEYKKNIVLSLVTTSAITLTYIILPYIPYKTIIILLVLICVLSLIISRLPNKIKMVVVSVFTVFALYTHMQLTLIGIVSIFLAVTFIGFIKTILMSVNKKALQDNYEISDLKEGMIPVYSMYQRNDEVYVDDKGFFEKIKESLKNGDPAGITAPKGKLLISSMAAGLTEDNITLLKKLSEENKIDSKIKIKRGVPL
ncbi:MAG TPA: A24 family peptidase C-terminal domain-containing protein [Methanobacterium sp.]|nr:A24 family peptidase C-terminal domain-containing protein [Methanobacterium sp.]